MKKITSADTRRNSTSSDSDWFAANPIKTRRFRPFIDGDDNGLLREPPSGFQRFTLVERLPSGALRRRFFLGRRQPLKDGPSACVFAERMHDGERIVFVFPGPNTGQDDLALQIEYAAVDENLRQEEAYLKAVCEFDQGGVQ